MAANNSVNISLVNGERFNNVNVPSRQHLADYQDHKVLLVHI